MSDASANHRWQSLSAQDRRVLGTLVEKAKTTPEQYPLTVSSLRSGCNQKTNRYPLMELEPEDVEESLERLRHVGAVCVIQGSGRVDKFKHMAYEWLGVDKLEAAVMTELLLRGTQTEGELRARAARMEPIADLPALRPVLNSLKAKGLVIPLTPEGRGHIVTHALYEPRELEKQRAEVAAGKVLGSDDASHEAPPTTNAAPALSSRTINQEVISLRNDIDAMRDELNRLSEEFQKILQAIR